MSIYFNNPWKPALHQIVKSKEMQLELHTKGFSVVSLTNETITNQLLQLYSKSHHIESKNGGMFYSIYSQDLDYRRSVHESILKILLPFLESYFNDYKPVLNSFVVKVAGPKSEFYLHQDTTGLDEWKHSPLSLWIPLQDVDEKNGCLGVIPFSQHFFSPYRSISFPAPFDNIQQTAKQYLSPLRMKVGEVLVFDNRILHHSYANHSGKDRVAVICGLFPKEASMITCHKPVYECGGKVELIEHDDDFLLTGKNFLIDCQKRPETGKTLGWVDDNYHSIQPNEFEELCKIYQVEKVVDYSDNHSQLQHTDCAMIGEPNYQQLKSNKSIVEKLVDFLHI